SLAKQFTLLEGLLQGTEILLAQSLQLRWRGELPSLVTKEGARDRRGGLFGRNGISGASGRDEHYKQNKCKFLHAIKGLQISIIEGSPAQSDLLHTAPHEREST